MKKEFFVSFFFISFAILANIADASAKDNKTQKIPVVAKVNNVALTELDWWTEYQGLLPGGGDGYHGNIRPKRVAELKVESFNKMIESELKYQDAVKKKLKVTKEELDSEQEKVEKRFKSKEEFQKALKDRKATVNDLRLDLKRTILIKKIAKQEVEDKVKISEDEMKSFYDGNKNIFIRPEEIRVSHILVRVDPSSGSMGWERGKKKIEEALAKLRKGAKFEDVVKEYSDDYKTVEKGGDLGFMHKGMTIEPFDTAATSELKNIGQISDIVQTIYGYHIIKLTDKKEAEPQTYDQVKNSIYNILYTRKKEKLYSEWMESLKKNAKIEDLRENVNQTKK